MEGFEDEDMWWWLRLSAPAVKTGERLAFWVDGWMGDVIYHLYTINEFTSERNVSPIRNLLPQCFLACYDDRWICSAGCQW